MKIILKKFKKELISLQPIEKMLLNRLKQLLQSLIILKNRMKSYLQRLKK